MEQQRARTEHGRPLLLAGLQEHYTMETAVQIPALWKRLVPIPGQIGGVTYGLVTNPRDGKGGFDYLAGVEVSGIANLAGKFVTATIPAQPYLVYTHREHLSKLRETMGAIWKEWIAAPEHSSEYGLDLFERYGESFNPMTGFGDVEVWVPVSGRLQQSSR